MASPDDPVEQLLSSKAATPIAQLNPGLPDQPTRKVHGEVTITWPYSAVSKSIAFLLAEPDFRLRRDKGSVRIHLSGPSAEALGKWELGSGDEVTLALDGVEWAKDEEPVRPAGSRVEWQLKFAGRLVLKAVLGETSETKSINVDEAIPVEVQPPEADEPIPFAEIDTTIFDDEPAIDRAPPRAVPRELASPMFMKRSRASYGPLFELDLDDELEEDGGRKGSGRKRPRYSVQNRMWRYREDSSSPEPEAAQHSPPAALQQTSDVEMEETPAKPVMTDGGCQTEESDLAPPPSSMFSTPDKKWHMAGTSPSLGVGVSRPLDAARTDTGVQAFSSKPATFLSNNQHGGMAPGDAPNPFAPRSDATRVPQTEASVHPSLGTPQNNIAATSPGFRQPSVFGTPSNAPKHDSNQGFPQASSVFGSTANGPLSQGFGQTSSLFGTGPAPTPSGFPHATTLGSGFGATGSSLRFGFGQESQSGFSTPPFAPSQPPVQQADPSPYPESYLDHDATSDYAPSAPQNPFGEPFQDAEYHQSVATMDTHGLPVGNMAEQEGSPWPVEQQDLDSSHQVGRMVAMEGIPSDKSASESTPPGMIPPHVADGTRNADEMQQQGLLYRSVYQQGVPRNALPDSEDALGGEEDAMDSDDQAYDEAEKGDDYDLRNYDRVSDDEEGYDEQTPLPDDELIDEDEGLSEEEGSYDEEDYDEEEEEDSYEEANRYTQPQRWPAHPPPQAQIRKDPVVIDLLSDSDDDEPQPAAVQATQSQTQQQQSSDPVKNASTEDASENLDQDDRPVVSSPPHEEDSFRSQQDEDGESDRDATGDFDEAEESLEEDEDISVEGESDASQDNVESEISGLPAERISPKNANATSDTKNELAGEEDATAGSPQQANEETRKGNEEVMEEVVHTETITMEENCDIPSGDGAGDAMDLDEEHRDDLGGSFQTQPADMLASFQTETTAEADLASSQTHDGADEEMTDAIVHGEARGSSPRNDAAGAIREDIQVSTFSEDIIELFDEDSEEDVERGTDETVKPDDSGTKQGVEPGEQQDVPPSPPESQDREVDVEPKVEVSMSTTITTHIETQVSDQERTSFETQDTEMVLAEFTRNDADRMSITQEKDIEMVDAESPGKVISSPEQASHVAEPPSGADEQDKISAAAEPGSEEAEPESKEPEVVSTPLSRMEEELPQMDERPSQMEEGPLQTEEEPSQMEEEPPLQAEEEPSQTKEEPLQAEEETNQKEEPKADDGAVESPQASVAQIDGAYDEKDEQPQSTSEVPEETKSPSADTQDADASFATAESQTSEAPETEEVDASSPAKPKRGARKTRTASGARSAKSATASKRGQLQSSLQLPISQRATRSKTMGFQQAASPKNGQEDMSIKIARAALKSPSGKTKKKAPTGTVKSHNTDLTKRLETDMPDCVSIKDLKKYNSRTLDVAAVVTSANTPPKRTATREYASSFTITDPSFAPSGVVEVDLYSLHRDHLPVVKVGDAVLLRAFTVVSLPGRGFGLKTDKNESSWAVFEAGGEDEPQMRAAPVEMNKQETKFLLDLRAWYAGLDEGAGQELAEAVGDIIEAGRESRAKK